jgi:hypothetical protein
MHDQADPHQSIDVQDAQLEATRAQADLLALVDHRPEETAADEQPASHVAEPEPVHGVTIEEMPAAPDADQAVHDADAPAWSPTTDGPESHLDGDAPQLADAVAALGSADPADAEVTPADAELAVTEAAGAPEAAPPEAAPPEAAPPDAAAAGVTAAAAAVAASRDRVEVRDASAERIEAHTVSITQGGAGIIRGDQVKLEQGGAFAIVARRIDIRDSGAFILLARKVTGDVTVALDWRAIAALVMGIIAIMVVRGRR